MYRESNMFYNVKNMDDKTLPENTFKIINIKKKIRYISVFTAEKQNTPVAVAQW